MEGEIHVNLSKWEPMEDGVLPAGKLKEMQDRLWDDNINSWLTYGPDFPDSGFQKSLAQFLNAMFNEDVHSENLASTYGIPYTLSFLCNRIFTEKTVAFIEDKVCGNIGSLLDEMGFNVVEVPLVSDGLDLKVFEELITKHCKTSKESQEYAGVAYLMPSLQDPTGISYSKECREKLIYLARRYNILIITNDSYAPLLFGNGKAPARLTADDKKDSPDKRGGNVVSIGCFGCFLSPCFDFGWIDLPPRLYEKVFKCGEIRSSGSLAHYFQGLFKMLLNDAAVWQLIEGKKKFYMEKYNHVLSVLSNGLPKSSRVYHPKGGYFVWLEIPGIDTEELNNICKKNHGISFTPGKMFSRKGKLKTFLRINFTNQDFQTLKMALDNLCKEAEFMVIATETK